MFQRPSPWPGRVLALISLSSLASLALALVAQHYFDVRPCPWCVLQRGVFLLLGLAAGLGWLQGQLLSRARALTACSLLLVAGLALAGLAAAVWQHEVAAQSASCNMTFADQLVMALHLDEILPSVFMATAGCNEAAAYKLLGLPYEVWSGLLYLTHALAAAWSLRTLLRQR
ncbi:disulfide bond formation protein B [Roseateles sp. DB2]|uniref:disulfide bond formation protein B n=1 Tax=Roseateles sp. DB2 TaxID=3453717 RepID=UPI003EED3296